MCRVKCCYKDSSVNKWTTCKFQEGQNFLPTATAISVCEWYGMSKQQWRFILTKPKFHTCVVVHSFVERLLLTDLLLYLYYTWNHDSSVGIATRLWAGWSDDQGSIPGGGWEFFSSTPWPERFWVPLSLLSNGYRGLFPWGQSGWDVMPTTHLNLVPRSRMRGSIPPLP
jgi:hypothetical protein